MYKRQSLTFLKSQTDHSFDIIYADPMFSETIKESENLNEMCIRDSFGSLDGD